MIDLKGMQYRHCRRLSWELSASSMVILLETSLPLVTASCDGLLFKGLAIRTLLVRKVFTPRESIGYKRRQHNLRHIGYCTDVKCNCVRQDEPTSVSTTITHVVLRLWDLSIWWRRGVCFSLPRHQANVQMCLRPNNIT